jgi:putative endonuclease
MAEPPGRAARPEGGSSVTPRLLAWVLPASAPSERASHPGDEQHSAKPSTRTVGTRAERRALWHFRLRGYRILATNAWAGGYELDLVVRRGRTVVFCEVKSKGGPGLGDPLEMVTAEKARRIARAAETWLAAHPELSRCEVRFDVVAERGGKMERVANAF